MLEVAYLPFYNVSVMVAVLTEFWRSMATLMRRRPRI
jgi:hypothetical protein